MLRWMLTFQPPLNQSEPHVAVLVNWCRWMSPGSFWVRFHFPVQREHNLVWVRHNPFPSFSYLNMNLPLGFKATICDGSSKHREISRELQKCQSKCHQFTKSTPAGNYILVSFFFFLLCWVFVVVDRLSLVAESKGYSSLWCYGLLTAVAFLVAEHRL